MIGSSNSLQEPRAAFRRANIDHQIDVAPVHAKIERRRAHHRPQFTGGHRIFDTAPLRDIERAVMQRDGEIVVVRRATAPEKEILPDCGC